MPGIPPLLLTQWASAAPPNLIVAGFSRTTYFHALYLFIFLHNCAVRLCCDSPTLSADLSRLWHITTQLPDCSVARERPPSVIVALCCVRRPRPLLICAGHVRPRARPPLFSFVWFFTLTTILARGRHTPHTPHPGERRTHLSHFWVPARCMFCGAAEHNNVAWRNSGSPSQHSVSRALPAQASPEPDAGSRCLKP